MAPFISFEGIDGSGKTTQLGLVENHLRSLNIEVVVAREPGGTEVGESIRQILLHSKTARLQPISELLLYYASRHQNLCQNILPALQAGRWVLCDRFADASLAYQGYGRGIDLQFIQQLNRAVVQQRQPDLTVLIDIDPALALSRARERNRQNVVDETRFEKESLEFFHRVRQGYLKIAQTEPERVRIVSGNLSIEEVHQEILMLLPYGIQ